MTVADSSLSPDQSSPVESYRDSLLSRALGVLTQPATLFRRLGGRNSWIGILAFVVLANAGVSLLFWSGPQGHVLFAQARQRTMDTAKARLSDSQFQIFLTQLPRNTVAPIDRAIQAGIAAAMTILSISLVFLVFFNVMFLRRLKYVSVLTVAAHAAVVLVVEQVVLAGLMVIGGDLRNAATVPNLFPGAVDVAQGGWSAWLGTIDVAWIWFLYVVSVGLGERYEVSKRGVLLACIGTYLLWVGLLVLLGDSHLVLPHRTR